MVCLTIATSPAAEPGTVQHALPQQKTAKPAATARKKTAQQPTTKKKTAAKQAPKSQQPAAGKKSTRKGTAKKGSAKGGSQTTVTSLQNKQKQLRQDTEAKKRRKALVERDVKRGMESLLVLNTEIDQKRRVIDTIRHDISTLDGSIALMDRQLDTLSHELEERKQRFMKSLRYLHRNRSVQSQLMFIFGADNFNQMYRRMRFTREYATYQRAQGEAVKQKQQQIEQKQALLAQAKLKKDTLLNRGQREQRLLEDKQTEQKKQVDALQKEQRTLAVIIERQQRQDAELNAQIDKLIAEEIARAKAAAEAEARKKAAAEAARKRQEELARKRAAAEAARKENERRIAEAKAAEAKAKNEARQAARKSAAERAAAERKARQAEQARRQAERQAEQDNSARERDIAKTVRDTEEEYTMPAADRKLSGSFEQNRGRLPMPVAGPYKLMHGFGSNVVADMKYMQISSKGIYLKTPAGAQARSIYDGEVTGIYMQHGHYVVMIRHGKYISVYYGLASVNVRRGQRVSARQTLGAIGNDGVMQFQLRNWIQPLNPMKWLGR